MKIEITKYDANAHYNPLIEVLRAEGKEWEEYLEPQYKAVLENSITYVALADDILCGFSRSLNDNGLFVWVIDLLVDKKYRGHSIGKMLMECVTTDFPGLEVYVLSDVDAYYGKLGYSKEGTVFRVMS